MIRSRKHISILLLALAVALMLITGCSKDSSPVASSSPGSDNGQPATSTDTPYPALDQVLAHMPAGYSPLTPRLSDAARTEGRCDTLRASHLCFDEWLIDQTVSIPHLVSIKISHGDLSSDALIKIVAPSACVAAADFYPHPYQFAGTVEITWSVKDFGLPSNFDYSTLIPWYVTDAGEFVQMPYAWVHGHDYLVVYTNHFSRYILGSLRSGSITN
jgi:hypothetical protein